MIRKRYLTFFLSKLKVQKVTKAILVLTSSYIALITYAFGVFLQDPVVKGEVLTLQAVIEPIFYIVVMAVGNLLIFKTVYSQEKSKKQFFDERKLLLPAIALLMLVAFGAGIHTTGQLIEETFVNSGTTAQHFTNNFSSKVSYFLEEYPGHFLVAIPTLILSYFLAKIELNRKRPSLKSFEKLLIFSCAVFFGAISAVVNAEGHVTVLILPLSLYLLFKLYRFNKSWQRNLMTMPYSSYFAVSMVTMIVLNIVFGITNGWFVQPTELGFGSVQGN